MSRQHRHYFRDVSHLTEVDVYRVCMLFAVNDPSGAIQHAIKKLLLTGARGGGKTFWRDLKEARDTLNRRLAMMEEDDMALVPRPSDEQVREAEALLTQGDALAEMDPITIAKVFHGVRHGPDGMPFDPRFDQQIDPRKALQTLIRAVPSHDWSQELTAHVPAAATVGSITDIPGQQLGMTVAARDVIAERLRQVSGEGWTASHDDTLKNSELQSAAAAYALASGDLSHGVDASRPPACWPWPGNWWKPKNARRSLVKSAALTLAAIERFDRLEDAAEARVDMIAHNGGEHHEALPFGLSWDTAPSTAMALVRQGGKGVDRLHVWVPHTDRDTLGVVATAKGDQAVGSTQHCGFSDERHAWAVVAHRPTTGAPL